MGVRGAGCVLINTQPAPHDLQEKLCVERQYVGSIKKRTAERSSKAIVYIAWSPAPHDLAA
jgi:hypothetical protein